MLNILKQVGKAICYVALYFGLQMIISVMAVVGYSLYLGVKMGLEGVSTAELDPNVINQQVTDAVLGMTSLLIIISGVLALLILWLFFKIRRKKLTVEAKLNSFDKKYWPAVLIGSLGLCLFVNFGMQLLPIPEDVLAEYVEASESLMEGPFILLFISNAIMAPVVEEILLRGLVFDRLQKAMPVWLALVLSSVLFGLMHGQILWVCYTTLVGLILGLTAWRTQSTLAPMFMHFAFNLFGTGIGYLVEEVTGMTCIVLTVIGALCLAVTIGLLLKNSCMKNSLEC